MQNLAQNESTAALRRILVYLVNPSDGVTPVSGVTPSSGDIKVSKNGAAEVNCAGTWTEIATGTYYYQFTAGELDTFGFVEFKYYAPATARAFVKECQVVANSPYSVISISVAAIWDYLLTSILTAGSIGKLIKDNLNTDLSASFTSIASSLSTIASYIDTEIAAIKTKTDQLTFTNANKVDSTTNNISSTVVDSILDDTPSAELASIPTATASLRQMIQFIYTYLRNRRIVSTTTETLYKDNNTSVLGTAAVADDGTTLTKGKMA